MTIDHLKAGIFRRYIQACEDIHRIEEKKKMIRETVYATGLRYDIEKYEHRQLLPGGDLLTTPPERNPYMYGLDQHGRPCYFQSEHTWNQEFWEGFYEFTDDEIYLVSYNQKQQKPVGIYCLLLENGKKTGFLLLQVNGHKLGKSYKNLSNQEIADALQADEDDLLCRIEQYLYDGDRIGEVNGWCTFPGLGAQSYQQIYHYDADGHLEEIKRIYSDNRIQYLYVKVPASLTIEALSDQLALEMAQHIAASLDPQMFNAPLAIMQLYYQEIGNYDPYITVLTVDTQNQIISKSNKEDLLANLFMSPESTPIPVADRSYERLLTAFINQVEKEDNYAMATAMIRKVAHLLTTQKLFGKIAAHQDFICYAVDWSLPPEEALHELMTECGMSPETLKKWQQQGVFLPESD